jgi:hypothetical protein
MDHDQAQLARHAGELTGAVVKPASDANGWLILLHDKGGREIPYTGHTGTEKIYHDLNRATLEARELGFDEVRVEERF